MLIKKPTPAHNGRGDKSKGKNINVVYYNFISTQSCR